MAMEPVMDFNQLRSFIAVSRLGHLTRAAESLHLSQPALSGQIKALEESLGVTLFRRSSSGMTLTPSGKVLLEDALRTMEAVQHMQQTAQGLRGTPTGRVVLGTVLDPGFLRVGELLAQAMERYPQIELELHQQVSNEALDGVRDGTLDATFFFGGRPEGDLESVHLRDMRYLMSVPVAWKDEVQNGDWWKLLAARPWVTAPALSSHRQLVTQVLERRSEQPERLVEADNEYVIVNLVESGVGASLVREVMAIPSAEEGRIAIVPGIHVDTALWLAYLASRRDDPLLDALLNVLGDVWHAEREDNDEPTTAAGTAR
jgi:DNA-binding transcriptional LysR family regulator